ncbi:citrate transporter family protein [Clostridium argentinense CDC 2741]|uniref:Citrate transporter family protein n=1 Tax=Clostridium argentinense CDC 2741 TaxID=1418104 RepID=A0A0C1U0L6_9CLOT|nr:GntP family permease [Clostridium argentinense]ARC84024.1 gluconate:proton symporter [Clostridium argentinense]KIE45053.1 citrate transporter family protein [Clostridium argentinense CDC 2741]NFF39370.1 GntP family permease [Clostridium argentinense]NFP50425.1 GntP family permease [Clostridium argentinense]NFP73351.1 GntP family permease [Clostridium argentinense]
MEITVSTIGALIALMISIFLIFKKLHPAYSLMLGAIIGGLLGGGGLQGTTNLMIDGAKNIMPAVLRIISAGVLAGVLIESGAAVKISETIVQTIGDKNALIALSIATLVLTAVGVFIDVAVITVAPIALSIGAKSGFSKPSILLAMIGGGKAGNIISPNPNTISVSQNLEVSLTSVITSGIIPAIFGFIVTCILARSLINKGSKITFSEGKDRDGNMPSFFSAIIGPLISIFLLALRPIMNISIDSLIALPLGAISGAIFMGKIKQLKIYATRGLEKMSSVAILLIGTGALAGIIANSELKNTIIGIVDTLGFPTFLLAPIAGILMSGATASTTSGATVASSVFGTTLINLGVKPLNGAAMIHSGATVLDHLPHGSFFHATAGSVFMDTKERFNLIVYESIIGLIMTIVSTIIYGIL